jgi:alkylation response protein AidB-like acyl-CoA dehydrogenase
MSVAAIKTNPSDKTSHRQASKPSREELVARALKLGVRARECAAETEKNRRVSAELVAEMRAADLFRILQPARFGGYEYGYDTFVNAVAAIGAGDGSTGWVYSLGAVHQWLIGCFSPQAQHDVWDNDPDAISAVSYAPTGTAERVPGGYRIKGRWSFASGVDNVQWVIIAGLLEKPEGGKAPGFFLVPKQDYTIDDDWFTMGLAGTGSKTVVADGAFVPDHRTALFSDLLTGNAPGAAYNPNPLYRQPFLAVVPTCLVSPQIGMARGALQVFVDQVRERKTRGAVAGGGNSMADFATVQMRVAEAAGCLDAAETVIHRDLAETAAIAARGEKFSVDLRLRNRRSHAFAVRLLVQGVDALFTAAGGSSLTTKHPLQRFWRDIHAASTHISVNWDAVGSMYGQHVFGLEPKGQY